MWSSRKARRLGLAAVAAIGLGAAALSPAPADAAVVIRVGAPTVYHRVDWRPGYWHRGDWHRHTWHRAHYWRPYWRPYYYAPVPRVAFRACPYGTHWVRAHWNAWGARVPAGCR